MISRQLRLENNLTRAVAAGIDKYSAWIDDEEAHLIQGALLDRRIHPGCSKIELATVFKTLHIGDHHHQGNAVPTQLAQFVLSYAGVLNMAPLGDTTE